MQDLLDEEEFLMKPFNPWKRFGLYSLIIFCFIPLVIWICRNNDEMDDTAVTIAIIFTMAVMPVLLSCLMVFIKKSDVKKLAQQTIIAGVAALMFSCCLSLCASAVYLNYTPDISVDPVAFPVIVVAYIVLFFISLIIILPIVKKIKRRNTSVYE